MPDGWKVEHKCAGEYMEHCIKNKKQPPLILLHGVPLSLDDMVQLEKDPRATLYPGAQLPLLLHQKMRNTRFDKEWSHWLWANIFAESVLKFLDTHKDGIIRKRKPFCLLALHPSNPAYHMFSQDYFFDDNRNRIIPHNRETYLKTTWKSTFDGIFSYTPGANGGWNVTKVYDPKNLFADKDSFVEIDKDSFVERLI
jgi:hypothetical protein